MDQPATFRLLPHVEARLAQYMSRHADETDHYRRMVKEHPEHAVKTIMCRKMIEFDQLYDLAERLRPLVKQWVLQTPGLHETIMQKIGHPSPTTLGLAYVEEALQRQSVSRTATAVSRPRRSVSP